MPRSVDELTREEVARLREAFSSYDTDGDGRITVQELKEKLKRLGEEPTGAELKGLLVKADADGNQTIDFPEFLAFMSRRLGEPAPGDEVREAFDAFDANGDGLVSIDELLRIMERVGAKMTREEAEDSLRRGDSDGDGQLSYDEFVAFMLGPR